MERALTHQIDKMTQPTDISQPLSLATQCQHNECMDEVATMAGMDGSYAQAHQHGFLLTKADLTTALWNAQPTKDRDQYQA